MRNETVSPVRVRVYRVFGTILMGKACIRPLQAQTPCTHEPRPPSLCVRMRSYTHSRAVWTGILHYAVYTTPEAIRPTRPDVCKTYFHRRRAQKTAYKGKST